MSEIRVCGKDEFGELIRIVGEAYPDEGITTRVEREREVERFKQFVDGASWTPYGVYRDGKMVGVFRNFDFKLNVRGNIVEAGGLGMVAVDLAHKKAHIAKEIVESFLAHYGERGYPMTMLWPFRVDFYHQMGFGLGGRMYQYRVRAADLPGGDKSHVRFLTEDDIPAMVECYGRYHASHNGLVAQDERTFCLWFQILEKSRFVGVELDGKLEGFFIYRFTRPDHPESFMDNNMLVYRLVYHTPEALSELLAFLHSQLDQVTRIHVDVPEDEFYYLMNNPTMGTGGKLTPTYHESHIAGVGIMYRVMDTASLFKRLATPSFGDDKLAVKISLTDSFYSKQNGSTVVRFENGLGRAVDSGKFDVEVRLDIAEFSSLLMGSVSARKLHTYSLMTISDKKYLDRVDRLFYYHQKPFCLTGF